MYPNERNWLRPSTPGQPCGSSYKYLQTSVFDCIHGSSFIRPTRRPPRAQPSGSADSAFFFVFTSQIFEESLAILFKYWNLPRKQKYLRPTLTALLVTPFHIGFSFTILHFIVRDTWHDNLFIFFGVTVGVYFGNINVLPLITDKLLQLLLRGFYLKKKSSLSTFLWLPVPLEQAADLDQHLMHLQVKHQNFRHVVPGLHKVICCCAVKFIRNLDHSLRSQFHNLKLVMTCFCFISKLSRFQFWVTFISHMH